MVGYFIGLLSPNGDQHQFSPNDIPYIVKRLGYEN